MDELGPRLGPRLGLRRDGDPAAEVDDGPGERVGLAGLLTDLDRGRRAWPSLAPGLAVHRAWTLGLAEQRDPRWWPQGVTLGRAGRRRLVVMSAYERRQPGDPDGYVPGARITVLDRDRHRYRHVRLTTAEGGPLRVHAGGLAWHGPWLHVAATGRGFATCHWDDLRRLPDSPAGPRPGPRFELPVRLTHRATGGWRCSWVTVAHRGGLAELLSGEFATGDQTRRLLRFAVDATGLPQVEADGTATALEVREGISNLQGAVLVEGRWYLTRSHGAAKLGSIVVGPSEPSGPAADPATLVPRRFVVPMGVEDLDHDPADDLLWTVTEHPWRRWLVAVRRSRLG